MVEPNRDGWRQIVEGYLRALFDDARADRKASLSNSQSRFLREFATESVQRDYLRVAEAHLGSLLPPPDESCWQIVEEAEDRLLVEITVGPDKLSPLQVPFITTRLLLEFQDRRWRINDVFEPCIGCNMTGNGIAGQCFYCGGTGEPIGTKRRRFRWFKRPRSAIERCEYCSGTGQCSDCAEEDVPGWCRAICVRLPQ